MDQDQEDPPVVVEAEADGVADGAPTIPAGPAPPDPASRATIRMASIPRPWITAIGPRSQATATAREAAGSVPASPRLLPPPIPSRCLPCAKIPTRASFYSK